MTIRSDIQGLQGPVAHAASLTAIPAVSIPALRPTLLGGLLLLICP